MVVPANFFVQCACGHDLRFDYLHQVRHCHCGRTVVLSEDVKRYLLRKFGNTKTKKGNTMRKERSNPPIVIYIFSDDNAISFQLLRNIDVRSEPDIGIFDTQQFNIHIEGDRFAKGNIRQFTAEAFFKFTEDHKEALRRLA